MIATIQVLLFVGLSLVAFGLEAWALVDALTRRPAAFVSAGKRTRTFWLLLTGGGAAAGFFAIPPPVGLGLVPVIVMFAAVVPAAIYLTDVRPAVRSYGGGRGGPPSRGGW